MQMIHYSEIIQDPIRSSTSREDDKKMISVDKIKKFEFVVADV